VVRVIWSEEVSATSAVGGGPEASAAGEGPDTFTTRSELVATVACIAPVAEGITTSRLSDDKGAAEPSSITATASSPPGPAVSDTPMTARGADASAIDPTSPTSVTGADGGGVINASVAVTAAGTSPACGGTILMPGGRERASGEITRALDTRRFRGVKLSTQVSAWLREAQKSGVSKRIRRNRVKTN
jgi:hypothetical protein